jgi:outer membrane receptor protein involved in Fe transport
VVVAATRTPLRILESPVSIERINSAVITTAAVPDYYDLVKNLKGVDLTTSSLTFKTISTRGFNGSGNLRFNQLVDGMDNQAPGLNFSVGSIVGPTELDIDNVELLQGASSALYGSGGSNGTLLITSKNPFKYSGLSFEVKQGINHINSERGNPAPYYDVAMRWAKVIGEKFAFKISGQLIKAEDWQANDTTDLLRNNVFSSIKPGTRTTDPNYDGVNVFGDEASASMAYIAQAGLFGPSNPTLGIVSQGLSAALGRQPTQAEIVNAYTSPTWAATQQTLPLYLFANGLKNNLYGGQLVSRTGYNERDIVDYGAYNLRLTGAVHYKITSDIEASLMGNMGLGTTIYTGADRYSLKNLQMGQYKAEVRANNWYLRAYTTQENSGDSYTATTAALFINNVWKPNATWFGQYSATYAGSRLAGASDVQAHAAARAASDAGRFLPGSNEFKQAFNTAVNTSINAGGAMFEDRTNLYQAEGQYNFKDIIKFADILVGASYRLFHLNSHGTIFVDTPGRGPININETGVYAQIQKGFFNDFLRLTASARYDKNQNFAGRLTPRGTALIKVAPNNNIRMSYQTAYRFPTTQDQYINLLTGGANRLIGGLPEFETYFKLNTNPAYTSESIVAYRNSIAVGTPNPALLQQASFQPIKPERTNQYELGYRGLLTSKLLVDAYGYYSIYKDFIGRVAVGRGNSGDPSRAPIDLASPFTTDNISFVVNSPTDVTGTGWGASADYQVGKGYEVSGNVSSDALKDVPAGLVTFFNTPKWRANLGIGNNNAYKGLGFNVQWRWQDKLKWEGTFGTGDIPAFSTIDAEINYKLLNTKSMFKLGASNLLNHYYRSAFGNPEVGGIYYISYSYNAF